jgi:hypothetical protein
VYKDASNCSNICSFDRYYNCKNRSITSSLLVNPGGTNYKPDCYNIQNQILVNYYRSSGYYKLLTLNLDLVTLKKSNKHSKLYSSFCGDSEKIIGLYDGKLDIYNSNLELIQTVGQIDSSLPFYVNPSNIEALILNNNYILRHPNNITIVNIVSGIQVASIDITSHQIVTKYNKIYAVISNNNNGFELQVYNSNGKLERENTLIGFTTDCLLSFGENKIDISLNKRSFLLNEF